MVLRGAAWCCVVLRGAAWCCVVSGAYCCGVRVAPPITEGKEVIE